jgi:hypothetical protein
MEAADCLYGVSMKGGGSSRVVSEKVDKQRSGSLSERSETQPEVSTTAGG